MSYLAITIFEDIECTVVRSVRHLEGDAAGRWLASARYLKGWEPKEGDIICGCRIDRIGSECPHD